MGMPCRVTVRLEALTICLMDCPLWHKYFSYKFISTLYLLHRGSKESRVTVKAYR